MKVRQRTLFLAQFKQHCQPQKDVCFLDVYAQTFTCSKSTIETVEKMKKHVQSLQ